MLVCIFWVCHGAVNIDFNLPNLGSFFAQTPQIETLHIPMTGQYIYIKTVKLLAKYSLAVVHLIPSWNQVYCAYCSAKTDQKPVKTSLAKQTTGVKSLLS